MNDQRDFSDVGGRRIHSGEVIDVEQRRFRHADGAIVERDVVHTPGAVAIVAHDARHVFLVRQPRHPVGEPALLEVPAGMCEEGEPAQETARRELLEEAGLEAQRLEPLKVLYSSTGVSSEQIHLFLATEFDEREPEPEEEERIEIVRWPLEDLDRAIDEARDAKTVVGLLLLRDRLRET